MALQFPTNPSTGETYQEGGSATYTYNGSYWIVTTPKTSIAVSVVSASWGDQRSNVTWMSPAGVGGTLFIAEGKLYAIKGNNAGHAAWTSAAGLLVSGTAANNKNVGMNRAYLVDFRNETSDYNVVSASAYGSVGLALLDNGNLYGWGANAAGELGLGHSQSIHEPALIQSNVVDIYRDPSNVSDLNIYQKVLIKKTDGFIYGAGYNGQGQLGLGDTTARTTFTQIPGVGQNPQFIMNFAGLNGGILAQKSDNLVVATGNSGYGWKGDGTGFGSTSFVTASGWLAGDSTAKIRKAVGFGGHYDGTSWIVYTGLNVWVTGSTIGQKIMFTGFNGYGHRGNGRRNAGSIITPESSSLSANSVFTDFFAVGSPTTLYVQTGSTIIGWGYNQYGQLVDTVNVDSEGWPSASVVTTGVTQVVGTNTTYFQQANLSRSPLFKKADGNYYWAGWGTNGVLGIGENVTGAQLGARRLRLPIDEDLKYVGVINTDAGNGAYVAVTPDDRFYGWGRNSNSKQIDIDTTIEFFDPVLITPQILFK